MGEQTGSLAFSRIWSYVSEISCTKTHVLLRFCIIPCPKETIGLFLFVVRHVKCNVKGPSISMRQEEKLRLPTATTKASLTVTESQLVSHAAVTIMTGAPHCQFR